MAYNYTVSMLTPFLTSLGRVGYKGDLVLFVNNSTEEIKETYPFSIKQINFELNHGSYLTFFRRLKKYLPFRLYQLFETFCERLATRIIKQGKTLPTWLLCQFYLEYYPATFRFCLYRNYLIKNHYQKVFMTDTRDVIFQKDIFGTLNHHGVMAFEETNTISLGENVWNSNWILEGYGKEVLEAIKNEVIYCSGTILGDYKSICQFINDYSLHLFEKKLPKTVLGFDQGIFNYFVSYLRHPYFIKSPNNELIFTVGTERSENVKIINNHITEANKQELIPFVVHQYDRHGFLKEFVEGFYGI